MHLFLFTVALAGIIAAAMAAYSDLITLKRAFENAHVRNPSSGPLTPSLTTIFTLDPSRPPYHLRTKDAARADVPAAWRFAPAHHRQTRNDTFQSWYVTYQICPQARAAN